MPGYRIINKISIERGWIKTQEMYISKELTTLVTKSSGTNQHLGFNCSLKVWHSAFLSNASSF